MPTTARTAAPASTTQRWWTENAIRRLIMGRQRGTFARYFFGSDFSSRSQALQQMKTTRPSTVSLTGGPIDPPSGSPVTGQTLCLAISRASSDVAGGAGTGEGRDGRELAPK